MLKEKLHLPLWAVSLFGLTAALALGLFIGSRTQPVRSNRAVYPGMPTKIVKMQPEDSREAWRQYTYTADGSRLLELEIAYNKTKRHTHMYFAENGNITNVASFPDGWTKKPDFEARYEPSGRRIVHSEQHNADGAVVSVELNSDGSTSTTVHRADNTLASTILDWTDGSRITTGYAADGTTIVSASVIRPELHTVTLGYWDFPAAGSDSSTGGTAGATTASPPSTSQDPATQSSEPTTEATPPAPKFKIYMQGTKTLTWDYLDPSGTVIQHGTFDGDEGITINYFNPQGVIAYSQHWHLRFQDWSRKFYALDRVDEYFDGGQGIYRQLVLSSDQHTVRESRLFHNDGSISQVRYYGDDGYLVYSDDFDRAGNFSVRTPGPTQWRSSEWVGDALTQLPVDDKSRALYNLRGAAFVDAPLVPTGVASTEPLFVTPTN